MWCVNTMAAQTWSDPRTEKAELELPVFSDKEADDEQFQDTKKLSKNIFRSSSCNRGGPKNSKAKRRSASSSSFREDKLSYRSKFRAKNLSLESTDGEKELLPPKPTTNGTKRGTFSDNVFVKLARQYSLSRNSRRQPGVMTGKKGDLSVEPDDTGNVVFHKRERNRKISTVEPVTITKGSEQMSKNNVQNNLNSIVFTNNNTLTPHMHQRGMFTSVSNMTSSDSSCPNSPTYPSPPLTPLLSLPSPTHNHNHAIVRSSNLSPPPIDYFKGTDVGRPMSLGSLRGFGGGRPTSLSSVTSSISSRTSRGSDYFSSASSSNDHQVNSYRMTKDLPALDESESGNNNISSKFGNIDEEDEGVVGDIGDVVSMKANLRKSPSKHNPINNKELTPEEAAARKRAVFAAHDQNDINSVDHLAPVSTAAMLANPDLSYVDRVILELLETERMYVRSMRDVLSGYLATIRGNTELNICPNDADALFGNIRDVYDFNRHLLHELEKCYGDPVQVAQCFVSMNDSFRVYSEYCTHYPSSVSAMTRCMQSPSVARFFRAQQDKMNHTLPLGSYLLKPVQRILKYHLLLQELVKHCDKDVKGYPTIQHALSTMTKIARHINDMKKKHEDAVHIQEIQSLLTCWQGSELTTYGELVLEGEMRLSGAKNLRQVFLFDKLIMVTKRNEEGYLVCKIDIMCSDLMLLESVENNPCAFHILPFDNNVPHLQPGTVGHASASKFNKQYTLIAPCVEEKKLWTHHIKRLIIENHHAKIPNNVKQTIMHGEISKEEFKPREMPRYGSLSTGSLFGGGVDPKPNKRKPKPIRDGETSKEELKIKELPRYGSLSTGSLFGGGGDPKSNKRSMSRLAVTASTNQPTNTPTNGKNRRKSDTIQKKGLHLRVNRKTSVPLLPSEFNIVDRALKKSNDVESSDDISSDSVPNTPKNGGGSKFSFPILRGSVQRLSNGHITSSKLSIPKIKTTPPAKSNSSSVASNITVLERKPNTEETNKKSDDHVVYRRHKRRTSQPITFVEKRQSMKLTEEEAQSALKDNSDDIMKPDMDVDEFFKSPLSPRQSVSWDIQIVDAVFDRYKRESSMSVTSNCDEEESTPPKPTIPDPEIVLEPIPNLGSTYLTVPGDVAPSPLLAYKHSSNPMDRRKSRIQVLASDTSEDEDNEKIRRQKNLISDKNSSKNVESDGGSKSQSKKAKAESRRASMVIHDSDTDVETKIMMRQKAVSARKKLSIKRRERNARKLLADKNINNNNNNNNRKIIATRQDSVKSVYDNVSDEDMKDKTESNAVNSSSCLTTETSSVSVSYTQCSPSSNPSSSPVISSPTNSSQRKKYKQKLQEMREKRRKSDAILGKDAGKIKSGKVQGLIQKIKNIEIEHGPLSPPGQILSPSGSDKKVQEFSFCKQNDEISRHDGPSCRLINSSIFDPMLTTSTNTVTTTSTLVSSTAITTSVVGSLLTADAPCMKETNLQNMNDIDKCNNIDLGKYVDQNQNRISVVTTISLPLTLTSESSTCSSDNENISDAKITTSPGVPVTVDGDNDNGGKAQGKKGAFYLTRSVSIEDGSKTRRSSNLVLGTKEDPSEPQNQNNFEDNILLPNISPDNANLDDAKLFLFEKLCSVKPESKLTDDLSEAVDHVWSDQEKGILRTHSPDLSSTIVKSNKAVLRTKSLRPKSPIPTLPLTNTLLQEAKTEGITNNPNEQDMDKEPHIKSLNKSTSRSQSVRSTRSENIRQKQNISKDETSRGRSSFTRLDRSTTRDVKVIPERSVHKLAEKFNKNTSPSEVTLKPFNIPRRSRSVGHNLGRRKRLIPRAQDKNKESDVSEEKGILRNRATCEVTAVHSANVRPPLERKFIQEPKKDKTDTVHKTPIINQQNNNVIIEKSIFESPRNSLNLNKIITVEQTQSSVKVSLVDKTLPTKKISLVEMFAANPHPKTNAEPCKELPDNVFDEERVLPSSQETPSRYSQLFAKVENDKCQDETGVTDVGEFGLDTFYFGRKRYGSTSGGSPTTRQSTNEENTVKRYSVGSYKMHETMKEDQRPHSYIVPPRRNYKTIDKREQSIKRHGIIISESQEININNNNKL